MILYFLCNLSLFFGYISVLEIEFGKPTGNFYFELIQLNQTGISEKRNAYFTTLNKEWKCTLQYEYTVSKYIHCSSLYAFLSCLFNCYASLLFSAVIYLWIEAFSFQSMLFLEQWVKDKSLKSKPF
jgi:hypothetical protein